MIGTIAVRVDWSNHIGLGHVQRCLSLMDALSGFGFKGLFLVGPQGHDCINVVQDRVLELVQLADTPVLPGNWGRPERLAEAVFARVEQFADAEMSIAALRDRSCLKAVIVDHYGLDATWETQVLQMLGVPVIVIDGLANRPHKASLLIDPTYVLNDMDRLDQPTSPHTRFLRGPLYAPVAPHFGAQLKRRPKRDAHLRRVLINFGGSDPHALTEIAIEAIEQLGDEELAVDVVVGTGHRCPAVIEQRCSRMPHATFHHATSRMAELMVDADLAIGSGGLSTYERAFLGLPALVVVAAANQQRQVVEAERAGALQCLGAAKDVTANDIAAALTSLLEQPERIRQMGLASRTMMGGTDIPGSIRIAEEIMALVT